MNLNVKVIVENTILRLRNKSYNQVRNLDKEVER